MTSKFLLVAVLVGFVFAGCGKKKDEESVENALNLVKASEAANDAVDEATDAVAESGASGSASLAEASSALASDTITLSKVCTASSGKAVVGVTVSGQATKERSVSRRIGTIAFTNQISMSGTETRTWTKASGGSDISCSAANNAVIGWSTAANVAGLKLDIDVNRERNRTITMSYGATSKEGSLKTTIKGQRSVTFSSATVTSSEVTIEKEVKINGMVRTLTGTTVDGKTASTAATTSTKEGEPLAVTVVRNAALAALTWKTLTIKSGTLVSTLTDTSRVESTFENVIYSQSATNVCIPISGTISGKIFAADETTESHSFTMTFENDQVTKTVDGEEDTTYTPSESCDLTSQ